MRIYLAAVAALALCAPARADPPARTAAPDPPLADYPKGALAAGVEGEATLRCARNAHLALTNCVLVSESPPGQGFGDAALAMAARSPDNPKLNVTEPALTAAAPVTVRFRLHPPSIDPDLADMAHVLKAPKIAYLPSNEVMARYWPDRDLRAGISGTGRIHCRVTRQGRLTDCTVLEETPQGHDFGAAASLVAEREYRLTPQLYDGQPSDDGEANLSIEFAARVAGRESQRLNDPHALTAAPANQPAGALAAPSEIKRPIWIRTPTGEDYARFYPSAAMDKVSVARTSMRCEVAVDGWLSNCTVTLEEPPGFGFAAAAMRLATRFQMKATDRDGEATAGRIIVIPIRFQGAGD